ncbi:hypothetical protein [Stenotrophomonas sp. 24(2023)]|uniref:hypothetical protein n=1 Tax=Stenotrophomonas sp. 24(2023) TaxID=3068324 RepID=UPI0027E18A36|nr:hypothetical protein [Stenotrophomonas sp. 24(2023)]WMJ69600.1 hypothetical protein Q9R17_00385 [Stenotrophomonas sp. 24(2023)]
MSFQICIYDRMGNGLRIPRGWWLDLDGELPALVSALCRVDLPASIRSEHPSISPEALCALQERVEGSVWLT